MSQCLCVGLVRKIKRNTPKWKRNVLKLTNTSPMATGSGISAHSRLVHFSGLWPRTSSDVREPMWPNTFPPGERKAVAILTLMSPIDINEPTMRSALVLETKDSVVSLLTNCITKTIFVNSDVSNSAGTCLPFCILLCQWFGTRLRPLNRPCRSSQFP